MIRSVVVTVMYYQYIPVDRTLHSSNLIGYRILCRRRQATTTTTTTTANAAAATTTIICYCVLFYDIISGFDYIASNGRMIEGWVDGSGRGLIEIHAFA
jgi:hypothetical protein